MKSFFFVLKAAECSANEQQQFIYYMGCFHSITFCELTSAAWTLFHKGSDCLLFITEVRPQKTLLSTMVVPSLALKKKKTLRSYINPSFIPDTTKIKNGQPETAGFAHPQTGQVFAWQRCFIQGFGAVLPNT